MNNYLAKYLIQAALSLGPIAIDLWCDRFEATMSAFTAIQDMSNPSLILNSLREVGQYFHHALMSTERSPKALSLSELSLPDEVYKNVVDVFQPLAYYLQNKAQDPQKEKLGEMLATDCEIVDDLCEGILNPFIQGNLAAGYLIGMLVSK